MAIRRQDHRPRPLGRRLPRDSLRPWFDLATERCRPARKLDRITSVFRGLHPLWRARASLGAPRFADGKAGNFAPEIADPVRAFCQKDIDILIGRKGSAHALQVGGRLPRRYANARISSAISRSRTCRTRASQKPEVSSLTPRTSRPAVASFPSGHDCRLHARHSSRQTFRSPSP